MGLEDFNTDDSGSSSSNNEETQKVEVETKNRNPTKGEKFRDEWGMARPTASRDEEWVNARLEEGWDVDDFGEAMGYSARTVLEMFKAVCKKGYIELDDIPDTDDELFSQQHARWYVEQAIKHVELPYVAGDNSSLVSSNSVELPQEFLEGIEVEVEDDSNDDDGPKGLEHFTT